jgi:FkbM family methyltransferase
VNRTVLARASEILATEGPQAFVRKATGFLVNRLLLAFPEEHRMVLRIIQSHVGPGTMIDVGAATGNSLAAYVEAGWTVYAFEPEANNLSKLRRVFGSHARVHIDDRAVGAEDNLILTLFTSPMSVGLASLIAFDRSHRASEPVRTVTLRTFLSEARIDHVDFLKVDAEGYDLYVLQGFPWEEIRPSIVMCEFDDMKTSAVGHTWRDLGDFLVDRDYRVLVSEWSPLDRYGSGHRWARFEEYPCELASAQGWGNLIASATESLHSAIRAEFDGFRRARARLGPLRAALRLLGGLQFSIG